MPSQGMKTVSSLEIPDLDSIVHRSGSALVSVAIVHDAVHCFVSDCNNPMHSDNDPFDRVPSIHAGKCP
jgi:hypothetical protein